jgi:hypothetical protein
MTLSNFIFKIDTRALLSQWPTIDYNYALKIFTKYGCKQCCRRFGDIWLYWCGVGQYLSKSAFSRPIMEEGGRLVTCKVKYALVTRIKHHLSDPNWYVGPKSVQLRTVTSFNFSLEHGGSIYVRNINSTPQFHAVQRSMNRINVR